MKLPSSSSSFPSPSSLFRFILLSLTTLLIVCEKTRAVVKLPPNVSVPAVFVFGDSIMDTGNNNKNLATTARCNYPPYGKDFKGGIPTGRFSNGKVPSDFIGLCPISHLFFLYHVCKNLMYIYIYIYTFIFCISSKMCNAIINSIRQSKLYIFDSSNKYYQMC